MSTWLENDPDIDSDMLVGLNRGRQSRDHLPAKDQPGSSTKNSGDGRTIEERRAATPVARFVCSVQPCPYRTRRHSHLTQHMQEAHDTAYHGKNTASFPKKTASRETRGAPKRCTSCKRTDTPEWRRGPDGTMTLCNACGLHYAKLERTRQRQLAQESSRPKNAYEESGALLAAPEEALGE
jgi:hypothetical protein